MIMYNQPNAFIFTFECNVIIFLTPAFNYCMAVYLLSYHSAITNETYFHNGGASTVLGLHHYLTYKKIPQSLKYPYVIRT